MARGTSDSAAIYGRHVIEYPSGLPVCQICPSLVSIYHTTVDYSGFLAVAASQSGKTPEMSTSLSGYRNGERSESPSPTTRTANWQPRHTRLSTWKPDRSRGPRHKDVHRPGERVRPSGGGLGSPSWSPANLGVIPGAIEEVLSDDDPAWEASDLIAESLGIITVGRGFVFGFGLEAALQLKETSSILAEVDSAADLRHGPMAVVAESFPGSLFVTSGPTAGTLKTSWRSCGDGERPPRRNHPGSRFPSRATVPRRSP